MDVILYGERCCGIARRTSTMKDDIATHLVSHNFMKQYEQIAKDSIECFGYSYDCLDLLCMLLIEPGTTPVHIILY